MTQHKMESLYLFFVSSPVHQLSIVIIGCEPWLEIVV